MNFIDKAFESKLRGDDFLQAMADIYNEPEVREILDKYPQFVRDVILMIDYDTEMQMEGFGSVKYGYLEDILPELIKALKRCGAAKEAKILRKAKMMSAKKFEKCDELEAELAIYNDYDTFWDSVRSYIDASLPY